MATPSSDLGQVPVKKGNNYENAVKSIKEAEQALAKIDAKIKVSKDKKNQVVSKAGDVVKVLLEPASLVANVLNILGSTFSPCGTAGTVLQALVDLESKRRDNDMKIAVMHLDMARTLISLGTLKVGFKAVPDLIDQLGDLISRVCVTMESFGIFSEAFYDAKKTTLKHLIYAKRNKDNLDSFREQLSSHRNEIDNLLAQQTLLVTVSNTETLLHISDSVLRSSAASLRTDSKIEEIYALVVSLNSEKEKEAAEFVMQHGGAETVLNDGKILAELASKLNEEFSDKIERAVRENVKDASKQNRSMFLLKFRFTKQQIEDSKQTILKELKSGPYELIEDEDVKGVWKDIAAKESNVKCRKFIDALVYHFNVQFKNHKKAHGEDREDAWTRKILSKVHYHPSIADAIDEDSSGYISVEEVNDFMREKPTEWTAAQWVAYWAYGWDAENIFYGEKIAKVYKKLEEICGPDNQHPNADLIRKYLEETKEGILLFVNSLYEMDELDQSSEREMNKLRAQWRERNEKIIKIGLKSVNYEIDYLPVSMNAICKSDRIETTFIPLVALLLTRHTSIFDKLEGTQLDQEKVESAAESVQNILQIAEKRVYDLKRIWRRQRIDVDTQVRFYANGLFEDYYKKSEIESDEQEYSSWDSEDEWDSESYAEDSDADIQTSGVTHLEQPRSEALSVTGENDPHAKEKIKPREFEEQVHVQGEQDPAHDQEQEEEDENDDKQEQEQREINEDVEQEQEQGEENEDAEQEQEQGEDDEDDDKDDDEDDDKYDEDDD